MSVSSLFARVRDDTKLITETALANVSRGKLKNTKFQQLQRKFQNIRSIPSNTFVFFPRFHTDSASKPVGWQMNQTKSLQIAFIGPQIVKSSGFCNWYDSRQAATYSSLFQYFRESRK